MRWGPLVHTEDGLEKVRGRWGVRVHTEDGLEKVRGRWGALVHTEDTSFEEGEVALVISCTKRAISVHGKVISEATRFWQTSKQAVWAIFVGCHVTPYLVASTIRDFRRQRGFGRRRSKRIGRFS